MGRTRKLAGIVAAVALLASACGSGEASDDPTDAAAAADSVDDVDNVGSDSDASGATIVLGNLNPITGALGTSGAQAMEGHQLAVEEINDAGGIEGLGGATVELLNADSQGDPSVGRSEATRLIDEGAVVIMGAFQSAVTLDASLVAERAQVPFVNPTAVAQSLVTRGLEYFAMTQVASASSYRTQVEFLSELAEEMGLDTARAALLYESTDFGQSVSDAQKEAIAEMDNIEMVADVAFEAGGDLSSSVAAIEAEDPDFLLDASYQDDAINIARAMARLGMEDVVQVSAGGGIYETAYLETLGELADGKMTVNFWTSEVNDAASAFAANYEERFGEAPTANSAISYLTTYMVAAALDAAGSTDSDAFMDALLGLSMDDIPEHGRVMPYSEISFDPETGYNRTSSIIITQIQDGVHVSVWPDEAATAEMLLP